MARNTDLRNNTVSASRKLKLPVLLLLLVSLVLAAAVTSRAEELWTENYYRALDTTEQLSEAERDSIDRECIDLMKNYGVTAGELTDTQKDEWKTCADYYDAYYRYSDSLIKKGTQKELSEDCELIQTLQAYLP